MLFRLIAKLGIDSTEFNSGLKKAESGLSGFAKTMGAAFSTAAILAFIKASADLAGEISDLSDELNISTDEVQQLKRAALESGIAFDKFAAALTRVRKAKNEAISGDKSAVQAFRNMGIDPNQPDFQLFKQVGQSGTPAAIEMLGKGGYRLLDAMSKIHELGPATVISEENARLLDNAADSAHKLWDILKSITANTVAKPIGWLGAISEEFGTGFNRGFALDKTQDKGALRTLGSYSNGILEGLFNVLNLNYNARAEKNAFVNNPALAMPEIETKQQIDEYLAELEGDTAALDRMPSKASSRFVNNLPRLQAEGLTSIGGGFGPGQAVMSVQKDQLNQLKELNKRIRTIEEKVSSVPTE